jgi:pyrimidine operon attenuation protein/uracil phosphoribosyltransferase
VQFGTNVDVETAFEGLVWKLAFLGTKGEVLVHSCAKVGFKTIQIRPFKNDSTTNSQQPSVENTVLSAVLDGAVIALLPECLAHGILLWEASHQASSARPGEATLNSSAMSS